MKKLPKAYIVFFLLVISSWFWYMLAYQQFHLFGKHWPVTLTMVFGSFIAGASSEGGGAVAYPVFTLLLKIAPEVARNFSFAIQSVGMTAASLLIIGLKIPIEKKTVTYATLGGVAGLILGTFFMVQHLSGPMTKMFFVSLWMSFGFALFLLNRKKTRSVYESLHVHHSSDLFKLVLFGFIGGVITSFFGNGIDIFTFCLLTLYYGVSEKVATPTSVVIMTLTTIVGFFLHVFIVKDFQPVALEYWLVAIPVVIVFAPVGAYVISRFSRHVISSFLYGIIIIQYVGALFIIKPTPAWLLMSLGVILAGFAFFWQLARRIRKQKLFMTSP
ncbi:sulfite exporter TauE/SafE family protein [Ascidiimonas aurantiaca]|uniref:sulfite exporter TauE/SafE family protein n=1 Tax=Ascidiimonas aurantiaca TaxID=1685432 RepID=UPI0030EEAF2F